MAKKTFTVNRSGTYGKKGDLIELEVPKTGLTDRQKLALVEYKKPVVKSDESAELKALKAENAKLKVSIAELEALIEAAPVVEAKTEAKK